MVRASGLSFVRAATAFLEDGHSRAVHIVNEYQLFQSHTTFLDSVYIAHSPPLWMREEKKWMCRVERGSRKLKKKSGCLAVTGGNGGRGSTAGYSGKQG